MYMGVFLDFIEENSLLFSSLKSSVLCFFYYQFYGVGESDGYFLSF